MTKYVAVVLVVTLTLSACVAHREPPPLRGDPAPSPQPTGVLYGRVMHPDGASAPRSSVEVAVTDRSAADTLGTLMLAIGTLGLACLIPTLCDPVRTRPDGAGLWSMDEDELRDAPGLRVTAELGSDGPGSGPSTTISLPGSDGVPRRVPDLVYWDPELTVSGEHGRLDVGWPVPSDVPAGDTIAYTTTVVETGGRTPGTHVVTADAAATAAHVDARVYADAPAELQVIARTTTTFDGAALDTAYRSAGVPLPGLTPPSRGARCLAEDAGTGRLELAVAPCPLTDGDTEAREPVRLPGDCAGDAASGSPTASGSPSGGATAGAPDPCGDVVHPRTCVRLPEARDVSLVVLRTPFPPTGNEVVELIHADRRVEHSVPPARDGAGSGGVHPVHLRQPVRAGVVCVGDRRGSALALTELSVW